MYPHVPDEAKAEARVTELGSTERRVTEQEVAVHVFVPLDSTRTEEGVVSLAAMWDRFRELQRADRQLYSALPVRMPYVLPGRPSYGSIPVAGAQSADRLDQAILRRHRDILNLSLLLGAGPGREWPGLRERMEVITGPLGECHLGSVTMELGKAPAETPGVADVMEPERGEGADPRRVLRLLGRARADGALSGWAWSDGSHPEIPHFVRYLMHMTAMRHQWRTYRRLAESRNAGDEGPLAVVRLDGRTDRELPSTAEIHFIRESVEATWENARRALEASGLDGGTVVEEDRRFASSLLGWLDDLLAQLRRSGVGEPLWSPRRGPGRPVRVLMVADEWFPAHGGVSTFNSKMSAALARQGADVRVMVHTSTERERADAAEHGVRLLDVAQPGLTREVARSVPPAFTDGFLPDLVVGHGRVTGPAAKVLVERYFKNAGRLHFLHVEPDQAEANKPDAEGDLAARAEERTELELQLCLGALHPMPVGPRLEQALAPHLRTPEYEHLAPVRVDPGFDGGTLVIPPRPGEIPQVLFLGRLEDAPLKGLDIAARALGRAVAKREGPGSLHLFVRGIPEGESEELAALVAKWVDNPAVDVIPRSYSADPRRIRNDLARATLVLMPSRAEAFGLAGAEAIASGVPVLVSGRSGLGMLLRAQQTPAADRAVVDVKAVRGHRKSDMRTWAQAIHAVLRNPEAAFRDAADLRDVMATRYTWAGAAATVLGCAHPRNTA